MVMPPSSPLAPGIGACRLTSGHKNLFLPFLCSRMLALISPTATFRTSFCREIVTPSQ
uniref:Uncharacterized protein n=1 Tax=Anguilla anguilla TaxID=7936 RepID=A0A0E9SKW6_ANGAN